MSARLRRIAWGLVLIAATPWPAAAAQPNMIFVLVDDLRYDGMGFVNTSLDTPNIDALAAGGAHLSNAVVTTSLCSPSRATLLTGQSTRNHRIVDNNDASESHLVFFPSYLQAAGYATAFVGKWHMGRANDQPRPGFDHWVSFKGQGAYLPTAGIPERLVAEGSRHQLNVNGVSVPQQGYITDELTDYALEWLSSREREAPFFLYLSHKAVHADFTPAERHASKYAQTRFAVPDVAPDAKGAGKPMWVTNQRNSWHGIEFPYHGTLNIEEFQRRYYETLAAVDDSIGRLLTWVRQQDIERDTIIVFASDNGFLFGEHGLIDKRNAYEPSVRIPLLVYAPGRVSPGTHYSHRVTTLDVAPTLLDFADLPPPPQFEGQSFKPLITGSEAREDWRSPPFVYEYYWEWTFPQSPTTFAITVDDIKYIQYHGLWDLEELYDLRTDPGETVNLIHDPRYRNALIDRRAELYRALVNQRGERVVPFTERKAQGLRFRRRSGSGAAAFPESFLREPGDADVFDGFSQPQRLPTDD